MTRARDELWLHVPLRYQHHRQNPRSHDGHGYAQRSRFLTATVAATTDERTAGATLTGDRDVAGVLRGHNEADDRVAGLLAL
jgi:hypothetical protein